MLRADIYYGWTYVGTIGAAQSFVVSLRHLEIGEAVITVDAGHDLASYLYDKKVRAIIYYKDNPVLSGWIKTKNVTGYPKQLTLTVADDKKFLWNMLGWPVPGNAITNQTSKNYKVTAVAETAIKQIISANASRFPYLNIIPTSGRGSSITIKSRFAPLSEFLPLIAPNGISALQNGSHIDVDFYVPNTYPATVSEQSGVLTVNSFTIQRPTVTRIILGDEGAKTTRKFKEMISSSLETDYMEILESFVDARNTADNTELTEQGNEALVEGADKSGVSVTLAEVADFAYGEDGFRLGDFVPILLSNGATLTEQITEVVISQTAEDGTIVTPKIGDTDDDPVKKLVGVISTLASETKSLMREW